MNPKKGKEETSLINSQVAIVQFVKKQPDDKPWKQANMVQSFHHILCPLCLTFLFIYLLYIEKGCLKSGIFLQEKEKKMLLAIFLFIGSDCYVKVKEHFSSVEQDSLHYLNATYMKTKIPLPTFILDCDHSMWDIVFMVFQWSHYCDNSILSPLGNVIWRN